MKILKKSFSNLEQIDQQIETPSWRVEYNQNAFIFRTDNGKTAIVEGEVYYYLDKNGKPIRFAPSDDARGLLKHVYDSAGEDGFAESIEGKYNVAIIDKEKDSILVIGDAFNRVNLFYCLDEKYPTVSTEFRDILSRFNTINYDPAVCYCLLILGYPPLKHTPYSGLRRLAIGERLLLQNSKVHLVKAKVKPLVTKQMTEADLNQYAEILENAVLSRASQSENWVELSGWDSTVVLGILRKYFDTANVRAVVTAHRLSDGYCIYPNVNDIINIGKHYDVPVEVAEIHLANTGLVQVLNDARQAWTSHLLYEFELFYQIMANLIKEKGKPGAAVFTGSFADSLHDFGFSHYASLPYLSRDFEDYSNKIRAYLYSPSFLKKVIDNTFENDFAYKLFRWHHSKVEFVDASTMSRNERVFEYLLSFILSNSRLPFAAIAPESIFLSGAKVQFKKWLYENYFKDAVEQIDCQNMYFWLIWLYQHFRLQGNEKSIQDACFQGSGKRVCQPYYDLRFVKFMQMVPEDWGRGLEWRPAKYPLKHYGRQKLRVPYEILDSTSHYLIGAVEQFQARDYLSEVINNSVMTSTIWEEVRSNPNLSRFFDKEWLDITALNDVLATGECESGSALPLRLLLFTFQNRTNT